MVNNVKDEPPTRLFKLIRIENIRLLGIMILTMELNNIMEPKKDELQTRLFLLANYHLFYLSRYLAICTRSHHSSPSRRGLLCTATARMKLNKLFIEPPPFTQRADDNMSIILFFLRIFIDFYRMTLILSQFYFKFAPKSIIIINRLEKNMKEGKND